MIRVAVMVSGGGTNLQALIDKEQQGYFSCAAIKLVIASNSDAYALQRAETAGIESVVISRKNYASQEEFDAANLNALREHRIDMVVLAGYLSILGDAVIKAYPKRIINIHPSLIPSFCGKGYYGLKVHEAALERGVKVSGATVHYVNEIPDGGEIIFQKAIEVVEGDTPETLQKRIMKNAEWILLPAAVEKVSRELEEASNENNL